MAIREVDLDHAFAEYLEVTPAFQKWILWKTRFSRVADQDRLLVTEQSNSRNAKHWWKHWWTRLSDGTESETDIFAVFEVSPETRFALHIENKPPHGNLLMKQAVDYRRRAIEMAGKDRFLRHDDFTTLLLAPNSFLQIHRECAEQFDALVSYEEVSHAIPLFAEALR